MSDLSEKSLVVESNKLVEARYSMTLQEQRIILAIAGMIKKDDQELKEYDIKISDFVSFLGIKNNKFHTELKGILEKIMQRVLHIPQGEDDWLKTHWISSAKYKKNSGIITLRFGADLKPYLLQLKGEFTKYGLIVAVKFKSFYTIRIYKLLKQYETIGYREFDLEELKAILGISEDGGYRLYKHFKYRILNNAKKEMDKKEGKGLYASDISFDIEEIKQGRKVVSVGFRIKKQLYQNSLFTLPEAPAIVEKMKYYGITEKQASKYLTSHGENGIAQVIEYYEQRLKTGSVADTKGAYLAKLLQLGAGIKSEYEIEQEKENDKKQKKQGDLNKLQKQIDALQVKYKTYVKKATDSALSVLSGEELEATNKVFLDSDVMAGKFMKDAYKKDGFSSSLIKVSYRIYLAKTLLPDSEDFITWAKAKGFDIEESPQKKGAYRAIEKRKPFFDPVTQ